MQLFYIPRPEGRFAVLEPEESWHATRVLRLRKGDEIHMTDGMGTLYTGTMAEVDSKRCTVALDWSDFHPPVPWNLHIAIAPTKNLDRFEWFLEKATEIGISEITPLICEHAERETVKLPRLEKVILSAMKQSLKTWKPLLHEPVRFSEIIISSSNSQKLMGYCETGLESALHKVYKPGSDLLMLIGPEGDFSQKEVDKAIGQGFAPISLGTSRLRTETAGVVTCCTVALLNEIKK